jgi:hypothetical protein
LVESAYLKSSGKSLAIARRKGVRLVIMVVVGAEELVMKEKAGNLVVKRGLGVVEIFSRWEFWEVYRRKWTAWLAESYTAQADKNINAEMKSTSSNSAVARQSVTKVLGIVSLDSVSEWPD